MEILFGLLGWLVLLLGFLVTGIALGVMGLLIVYLRHPDRHEDEWMS